MDPERSRSLKPVITPRTLDRKAGGYLFLSEQSGVLRRGTEPLSPPLPNLCYPCILSMFNEDGAGDGSRLPRSVKFKKYGIYCVLWRGWGTEVGY